MTISVTTGTFAAPGVHLYYELRGSGPLVALVGSPMHAEPFALLAGVPVVVAESPTKFGMRTGRG